MTFNCVYYFCFFPPCAKSSPALALIYFVFVRFSICALFMCVLSYCMLVHGQYRGLTQAGCVVLQPHFKELALTDSEQVKGPCILVNHHVLL